MLNNTEVKLCFKRCGGVLPVQLQMKSIRREDPAAERHTEKHERQHDWVGFSWVDVTNLQEHFDFWIIKIRDGKRYDKWYNCHYYYNSTDMITCTVVISLCERRHAQDCFFFPTAKFPGAHTQCATAGTDEELMSLEAFDSDGSDNLDLVQDSSPSSECHIKSFAI